MTVAYPFPQARSYLSELSRYELSEACLLSTQSRTKGQTGVKAETLACYQPKNDLLPQVTLIPS